jgi:hypothetical protein
LPARLNTPEEQKGKARRTSMFEFNENNNNNDNTS